MTHQRNGNALTNEKSFLIGTSAAPCFKSTLGFTLTLILFFLASLVLPVQSGWSGDWVFETTDFNAVWGSGPGEIFAVGDHGVIRHYNGSAWAQLDLDFGACSSSFHMQGVWGGSGSDVYVVGCVDPGGGFSCDNEGFILHYDGAFWSRQNTGGYGALNAAWGSAPGDVFAVGNDGTILRGSIGGWGSMDSGSTATLTGVWGTSSDSIYAVGASGTILHFDGATWTPMSSGTTAYLNAVWGVSDSDVFAVGESGTVLHFDGDQWAPFVAPSGGGPSETLYGIWGTSATSFYVAGSSGTAFRFNYTSWSELNTASEASLRAVWGSSINSLIAVGTSSTILRYNGSWWSVQHQGTTEPLRDIRGVSDTYLFAVGDGGAIVYNDGTGWKAMDSGTTDTLKGVWGTSPTNVWAVGYYRVQESGLYHYYTRLYHYDGYSWTRDTRVDIDGLLSDIWGSAANDVHAVGRIPTGETGTDGLILHYDGASWSNQTFSGRDDFVGIWGDAPDNVFSVGLFSGAYQYDGGAWNYLDTDSKAQYGIWGNSVGDLFTVGLGIDPDNLAPYPQNYAFRDGLWSQTPIDLPAYFDPTRLYGLWGRTDNDIIAVGQSEASGCYGQIVLRFQGGAWWLENHQCTDPALFGIWGNSHGTLWAVGNNGHILRLPADDPAPEPVDPWTQWYGGEDSDLPADILPVDDGGSVLVGSTRSYGAGETDVWVVKLAPDGVIEWQKTYGGPDADAASAIKRTPSDGGYIVAGNTASFGAGGTDAWLLKLDPNGNLQWQKTYGEAGDDTVSEVLVDGGCPGGYALLGRTWSDTQESTSWVLKLDHDGEVEWHKAYDMSGVEQLTSIAATKGFGYVLAGRTDPVLNDGFGDFWVLRLDEDGEVLWQKQFGLYSFVPPDHYNLNVEDAAQVSVGSDGGILLAGRSKPVEVNAFAWMVKLDPFGTVQWQRIVTPVGDPTVASVQPTADNGFLIGGKIRMGAGPVMTQKTDGWLLKLDQDGYIDWQRLFAGLTGDDNDRIVTARQAPDGGYLATGYSQRETGPEPDIWVLRMDATGAIPDCWGVGTWYGGSSETSVDGTDTAVTVSDIVVSTLSPAGVITGETEALQGNACLSATGDIIDLARTGQTTCHDTWGADISCQGSGQDGETRAGAAWPSPRFTDNGDGTVTDELTGLMWLKDANCAATIGHDPDGAGLGRMDWASALDFVSGINAGTHDIASCAGYMATYNDWRLANVNELDTLLHSGVADPTAWLGGQGFVNIATDVSGTYWSSTTHPFGQHYAWVFQLYFASLRDRDKSSFFFAWPVRGGQYFYPDPADPANVAKTGQTTSFYPGDDGDLEIGVAWPSPRFMDHADGTVTDRLTGLMWLKDAGCLGYGHWQDVLDAVSAFNTNPAGFGCQDYDADFSDWHLPNRKELLSLIDRSKGLVSGNAVFPSGHPFVDVDNHMYWCSTTDLTFSLANSAWGVYTGSGEILGYSKNTYNHYAWAVRGAPKCEGDLDGDGDVDGTDLAILAEDMNRTDCCDVEAPLCEADLIKDCQVDDTDLNLFSIDFGRGDCPENE